MKRSWIFELGNLEDDTIIRVFRQESENDMDLSKQEYQRKVTTNMLREFLNDSSLNVEYDKNGAPHLNHQYSNISISHCNDFYAFILSKSSQVGIDIEKFRPSLLEGKRIYISKNEEGLLIKDEHALLIWSAKEVGYKLVKGGVQNYKNDIVVTSITESIIELSVNNQNVKCDYRYLGGMILMFATLS